MTKHDEKTLLIMGLGSMGTRRIRALRSLGNYKIIGSDINQTRAKNVAIEYDIKLSENIDQIISTKQIDAMFICVPPDKHEYFIKKCIKKSLPCFVEASVILGDLKNLETIRSRKNLKIAPSCTLCFHPAIEIIQSVINSNKLGKVSNFILHSGQYLPFWHPYENVADFYVSKKETGGAREIVAFELTWLTKFLGFPKVVKSFLGKTIHITGAEKIDDTYNCIFQFENFFGTLIVDVVSREGTRYFELIFSNGQIKWNWKNDYVEIIDEFGDVFKKHYKKKINSQGYDVNIAEDMYLKETHKFLKFVFGNNSFSNSLDHDIKVLELLLEIEAKGV
jgi:predicted dehydrogenase